MPADLPPEPHMTEDAPPWDDAEAQAAPEERDDKTFSMFGDPPAPEASVDKSATTAPAEAPGDY